MDLSGTLTAFFHGLARPGDGVIVAFSGGSDSTALLWGLAQLARGGDLRVTAAHLDHGLDAGSAARAEAAARTAGRIGVPLAVGRRPAGALRQPSEGLEAAARRVRYSFLEAVRREHGARFIATAHHRDDQAETVLLRILFGSGVAGLAAIRPVHGAVVRPLLTHSRAELAAAVAAAGLTPVDDPTNRDLSRPRNRLRAAVLPALEAGDPEAVERLARIADRTQRAGDVLERRLARLLSPAPAAEGRGVSIDRQAVARLPGPLVPFALAALHRLAGAPYPAGAAARQELLRQLRGGSAAVACDCGGGWRWQGAGGRLALLRAEIGRERMADFTYTLEVPGTLTIPELGLEIGLTRRPVEPWMFAGSPFRAALSLPLQEGDRVTVRNRRPGDRIHPLGARGSRRLKEVLVDAKVPRQERERLPLLAFDGRIAWVPGVTIDHRFRLAGEAAAAWVAEISTLATPHPHFAITEATNP